jgi:phenylalanyl-tRNA synthetase alpha chain
MSAPNKTYDPVTVSVLGAEAISGYLSEALAAVTAATNLDELKRVRLDHDGDRSPLALANREIGALPPAAKADAGRAVGTTRAAVREALRQRQGELEDERDAKVLQQERVDVTLPWDTEPRGARHPLTVMQERMCDVFLAMGWEIAEGPEVEAEWFTFDALNIPPDHPARSESDTLFVGSLDSGVVLRTHTSPVQVRAMLSGEPPLYVVCPGRVFRADELDATHTPVFHQVEGLVVDKGITMAHLKGTLDHLAAAIFGEGIDTRFLPDHFPFTEPSAQVKLRCFVCRGASVEAGGQQCRTCGSEGWIEWGGCGMVNPKVLMACGVDPDIYSGFAFGMGVERTVMFRNGVRDLRDLIEGDIRFTCAFGGES